MCWNVRNLKPSSILNLFEMPRKQNTSVYIHIFFLPHNEQLNALLNNYPVWKSQRVVT